MDHPPEALLDLLTPAVVPTATAITIFLHPQSNAADTGIVITSTLWDKKTELK